MGTAIFWVFRIHGVSRLVELHLYWTVLPTKKILDLFSPLLAQCCPRVVGPRDSYSDKFAL